MTIFCDLEEIKNSDGKVYCRRCKYLCLSTRDETYKCSHPQNTEERDTPLKKCYDYAPIEDANSNNDCPYYDEIKLVKEEAKKDGTWEKLNRIRKKYCFL